MIRDLKILMLVAMVLGAIGVFDVSGAQAAEQFHCSVEPCTFTLNPDGTGTTSHHVLVVKNSAGESISFTCEQVTGSGTSATKTATELTIMSSISSPLKYDKCKSVLGEATVDVNTCDFRLTSSGGGVDKATVTVLCGPLKPIEITNQTCTVKINSQGPLIGIGYKTIGGGGGQEITVTAKVPGIAVEPSGECGIDLTKTPITAEYTTGNTLVTGETTIGVMASAWWE